MKSDSDKNQNSIYSYPQNFYSEASTLATYQKYTEVINSVPLNNPAEMKNNHRLENDFFDWTPIDAKK